jgi:Ca2+/H+ antiporter, TMEM165/GDT1 family
LEALLTSFLAAALAEWGDKTQLLIAALALRQGRPGALLAAVAAGVLLGALIAAFGGVLVHDMIVPRATSLLVALALLFAGAAGLISRTVPELEGRLLDGSMAAVATAVFLAEFGDKTQFLALAIAAQYDSMVLTALGVTAGATLACVPAALLGDRLASLLPVRALQIAVATALLLVGSIVAINALRLI